MPHKKKLKLKAVRRVRKEDDTREDDPLFTAPDLGGIDAGTTETPAK